MSALDGHPDRRLWVATDRPGERMAVSLPLPGVRVFSVTDSDRHCAELHEVHTLCVLHSGQAGVGVRWGSGRKHAFETGSGGVMVMELGDVHRTTSVEGKVSYSVVQIDPKVVREIAAQVDERAALRVRATSVIDPALQEMVMEFVRAVAREEEPAALRPLLDALVFTWLRLCAEDGAPLERVLHYGIRRARNAMRGGPSHGAAGCPRLDELAALSGLSSARFSHAFREWVGIPPHAYFNFSRLNVARRTLEQGASATDVAAALGFADLPHFSRHFRRQFGLSPRVWTKLSRPRH
jgi:AraC-like DNA-binding protein